MRVCYFGIYDPTNPRNRELIRGLRQNNVEVVECQVGPQEKYKYWKLFKKHRRIKNYDSMIVGFPGHPAVPLARIICRKPIIFDAFVSLYDSNVFDRQKTPAHSLAALKYWLLDWLSCVLADKVLLDSNEHIRFFIETFGIKKEKFERILVGADTTVFFPRDCQRSTDRFLVLFQGTSIPLQGVEYIIKAAKTLEEQDIEFELIGNIKGVNTKNLNFIGFMPQQDLAEHMAQADVCLGHFGATPKAKRCGAFKISEALAMKKPVITADTPAVREFLEDRENCLLCNSADAKDLAKTILELKNNPALRNKIADNGYKLFKEKLTPEVLGKELKEIVVKTLG